MEEAVRVPKSLRHGFGSRHGPGKSKPPASAELLLEEVKQSFCGKACLISARVDNGTLDLRHLVAYNKMEAQPCRD